MSNDPTTSAEPPEKKTIDVATWLSRQPPRNVHREAAIFEFFTRPEFYEAQAQACEDLAEWFGRLAISRGVGNYGRNGQIYEAFREAGRDFKRGADLVRLDEYRVVYDAAIGLEGDLRGMLDQPLCSWMGEEIFQGLWKQKTGSVSTCAGLIRSSLRKGLEAGIFYLEQDRFWARGGKGFDVDEVSYCFDSALEEGFDWHLPEPLPQFEPDTSLVCETGKVVPETGVWYPAPGLEDGYALTFAIKGYPMPPGFRVSQVVIEDFGFEGSEYESVKTTGEVIRWYRLRHVSDASADPTAPIRLKCPGGEPCPRDGYWWTTAKRDSRQRYATGQIMPIFPDSAWGDTIWYFDQDQQDRP